MAACRNFENYAQDKLCKRRSLAKDVRNKRSEAPTRRYEMGAMGSLEWTCKALS